MKKLKFVFISFGIFIIIAVGVSTVFAQEAFPAINVLCENKNGVLRSFDDGFSFLKKCPNGGRKVVAAGLQGEKGEKGDQGEPGEPGLTPDRLVDVCFHVPNGNLRVMITSDCGSDVHWRIPAMCVDGAPCKPDNPIGPFE